MTHHMPATVRRGQRRAGLDSVAVSLCVAETKT